MLTNLVSGCASNSITEAETCSQLDAALKDEGVTWPIAAEAREPVALAGIEAAFSAVSARSAGDIQTILDAWLEGYRIALPYLIEGDEKSFNRDVSVDMHDQIHLASTLLATRCDWM